MPQYRRVVKTYKILGILSLVQMSRIKLFGGYYLGTGLLSGTKLSLTYLLALTSAIVVGTSFNTLSTATAVSNFLLEENEFRLNYVPPDF